MEHSKKDIVKYLNQLILCIESEDTLVINFNVDMSRAAIHGSIGGEPISIPDPLTNIDIALKYESKRLKRGAEKVIL